MLIYAIWLCLLLTFGLWPILVVAVPLVFYPVWRPTLFLVKVTFGGVDQADPGEVRGCAIALWMSTLALTTSPESSELGIMLGLCYLASYFVPWILSGNQPIPAGKLRRLAAVGLVSQLLWILQRDSVSGQLSSLFS
jgi:hypothetical protein